MVQVHMVLGVVTLLVALFALIWNALRLRGQSRHKSYRIVLVGILDLQVLLGIITIIMNPVWSRGGGWFFLHPVLMLIALAIAHTFLKESRSARTQLTGYSLVLLLLLVGAWIGSIS